MITERELDYYKHQGVRTKVEKGVFDSFPDDISKLCKIIQGLLIHPGTIKSLYNLNLPESRTEEINIKTIQEILNRAKKLDPSNLTISREPEKRVVAICKHFSMLLCSILREKGIPTRTRCGFATYFPGGWFEDHWVCEYWNSKEKRWIRVDPQIDNIQAKAYQIDTETIDLTDLPKETFFPAGIIWQMYRDGFVEGKTIGYSNNKEWAGEYYIRGNMLRDFFALNKTEYLYQELNDLMSADYKPNEQELLLLDKIADLTINIDEKFDELVNFYENNKNLRPK